MSSSVTVSRSSQQSRQDSIFEVEGMFDANDSEMHSKTSFWQWNCLKIQREVPGSTGDAHISGKSQIYVYRAVSQVLLQLLKTPRNPQPCSLSQIGTKCGTAPLPVS